MVSFNYIFAPPVLGGQFAFGITSIAGSIYDELGCDSGSGDRLGCFQSRVFGLGPQIGYLFPVGDLQGYASLKGYREFENRNRPDGFNVWLTFAISPAAPIAPVHTSALM